MSEIDSAYKSFLKLKAKMSAKEKGDAGENLLLMTVKKYQRNCGGWIIHSYKYRYALDKQGNSYKGNLHLDGGKLTSTEGKGLEDEIDLILLNNNCIVPIECKAYGAGTITLRDDWWNYRSNSVKTKYPIAQEEKHCRHLYHQLYELLPDGRPEYIKPLVVFVDRGDVVDQRSTDLSKYITVANLNNALRATHVLGQRQLEFQLDVDTILSKMKKLQISATYYPPKH